MRVRPWILFCLFTGICFASVVFSNRQALGADHDPKENPKEKQKIVVGSKVFTESYILGEIVVGQIQAALKAGGKTENEIGRQLERRLGLGATGILFEALQTGEIDLYPEYTGTIAEALLKRPDLKSFDQIQSALKPLGLVMSRPLGFKNTYALATTKATAANRGLQTISDLRPILPQLRLGFGHEFTTRADGVPHLARVYKMNLLAQTKSMDHILLYEALRQGRVDVIDIYSTDSKIESLGLVTLEDDLGAFPNYEAVVLAKSSFVAEFPEVWSSIQSLAGSINDQRMRELNRLVEQDKLSFKTAADTFLKSSASQQTDIAETSSDFFSRGRMALRTKEHLILVGSALLFSLILGVPLGILAAQNRFFGQGILLFSGFFQTIPSLALLCFLIPISGIGLGSSLIALCLYGLLPVVMNTFVGLKNIDRNLLETSSALGLTFWQALIKIRLPLASRSIFSGLRTSAVTGIGTATLAALIGAGGYGATILAGLATNDIPMITLGAAPAALMALAVHGVFEWIDFALIPKGLR